MFYFDKKAIVKRYSSSLGEYNRPMSKLSDVGSYECTFMNTENSTSQIQPQKQNYTGVTLYVDPEADIRLGDVLYIYEMDEYENIILSSEYIAVADKPYKKRTHLEIPLIAYEEV